MALFQKLPGQTPEKPAESETSMKLTQLVALVESAIKRVDAMQSQVDGLNSQMTQVVSSAGAHRADPPPKPTDEPPISKLQSMADEDLEQLSRKEFLALQREEFTTAAIGAMKELLNPFNDRLQGIEQRAHQSHAQTELEKFMNASVDGKPKYPDWKEHFASMKDILSKTQGLSIVDAYTMARARLKESDPNKFSEIEDKYFPKAPEQSSFSYGGLRTISHSSPGKETNMSLDDAMEATAREFSELHGPIPDFNN